MATTHQQLGAVLPGKPRYQVADLASLPRVAVVMEDRYSQLFRLDRGRPAMVAENGLRLTSR
jgi:hypothetical protein